jgi:SAM-dependent methyltransferase
MNSLWGRKMSYLGYKLLSLLARVPDKGRYPNSGDDTHQDPLKLLKSMFPGFLEQIRDKSVVDFGCGLGNQTFALAENNAHHIVGIEKITKHVDKARIRAKELQAANVQFYESADFLEKGTYDVVISQNSMEHFEDPEQIIDLFYQLVGKDGKVFITFGPPWFSPYGAHTNFFCRFPWIHLIFKEKTVFQVRMKFTDDMATSYETVRGGLNRMSLKKFEGIIRSSDFNVVYESYIYVLGLTFMRRVPLLRELLLYHINMILVPAK